MTLRKYLILLAVVIFGSCGDVCLGRGMRDFGAVTTANWRHLFGVLSNLWIVGGICLLILFFCTYLTALSWADLTYVLPATSLGYVLLALIAKFVLHEQVTTTRWLGIGRNSKHRRVRRTLDLAHPPAAEGIDGPTQASGHLAIEKVKGICPVLPQTSVSHHRKQVVWRREVEGGR